MWRTPERGRRVAAAARDAADLGGLLRFGRLCPLPRVAGGVRGRQRRRRVVVVVALGREHRLRVDGEAEAGIRRRAPAAPLAGPRLLAALEDLDVAVALPQLPRGEGVVRVRVDVRRVAEERAGTAPRPVVGLLADLQIFEGRHGLLPLDAVPDPRADRADLGGELGVAPARYNVVARMRRGFAVVVEAAPPEAPKQLRRVLQPVRLADVLVVQVPLRVGADLRDVAVDGQTAVRAPARPRAQEQDVGRQNRLRRALAGPLRRGAQSLGLLRLGPDRHVPHGRRRRRKRWPMRRGAAAGPNAASQTTA